METNAQMMETCAMNVKIVAIRHLLMSWPGLPVEMALVESCEGGGGNGGSALRGR